MGAPGSIIFLHDAVHNGTDGVEDRDSSLTSAAEDSSHVVVNVQGEWLWGGLVEDERREVVLQRV